jgi:hypothetical protein
MRTQVIANVLTIVMCVFYGAIYKDELFHTVPSTGLIPAPGPTPALKEIPAPEPPPEPEQNPASEKIPVGNVSSADKMESAAPWVFQRRSLLVEDHI